MELTRPLGMKITDMCKYIDDNVYKGELSLQETETIYNYLYWICYALTSAQGLLTYKEELNSFALYLAEQVYERLTSAKQYTNPPTLEKISSCLNYIKKIIYGRLMFWKEDFKYSEVIDPYQNKDNDHKNYMDNYLYIEELKSNLESTYRPNLIKEVIDEINNLPKLIKRVCKQSKFTDKRLLNNLYISCLLSFLNNLTLNNKALKELNLRKKKHTNTEYFITTLYQKEVDDEIILWELSDDYSDIVRLLLSRIKKLFIKEIVEIQNSYKIPDYFTGSIFSIERRDRNPHV